MESVAKFVKAKCGPLVIRTGGLGDLPPGGPAQAMELQRIEPGQAERSPWPCGWPLIYKAHFPPELKARPRHSLIILTPSLGVRCL